MLNFKLGNEMWKVNWITWQSSVGFSAHVRCKTNNNIVLFYPSVQDANDSFVACLAFVLSIMTSAVPFYMDHKPIFLCPELLSYWSVHFSTKYSIEIRFSFVFSRYTDVSVHVSESLKVHSEKQYSKRVKIAILVTVRRSKLASCCAGLLYRYLSAMIKFSI